MNIFKKNKILVTHNGSFHADDLFATAALSILNNGNIKIIRTRDPKIIETGDYVYDVGGKNIEEKNLFDHHQKGGGGVRENGIPYAAFGLVWKAYGETICGNKEVADRIDQSIVQPIDAKDNGVDIIIPKFENVFPYSVEQIFLSVIPTWKETNKNIDKIFKRQVINVVKLLKREIKVASVDIEGTNLILNSYRNSKDKKIIIIENNFPRYLYQNTLCRLEEPIYAIIPGGSNKYWKVEAIKKNINTMESRKLFPEEWRGLMESSGKLKEVTGVPDAQFCHQSGFFLTVGSKEGAIALAEKALLT
ncbi:MAG: MYG1 family protein [Patescibacteria group bacterium]|nr:MYG1 family protein [Patescibacteria group bacterium]